MSYLGPNRSIAAPELPETGTRVGDLRDRLLEAGALGCCAEGDLLALMPSVLGERHPWADGPSWLERLLGV